MNRDATNKPMMPLTTREGVEAHVAGIFAGAKEVIERGGKLRPQAVIYARKDPKLGIAISEPVPVGIPLDAGVPAFDEKTRARFAGVIRHAARELDAVGILTVFESVFAFKDPGTDEPGGRSEVVLVMLEHKTLGELHWVAAIDRDKRLHVGRHKTLLALAKETDPRIGRVNARGGAPGSFQRMLPEKWMN